MPRILVLPLAAVVITALSLYKVSRTSESTATTARLPPVKRPAPRFELYDQHKPSRIVRLSGYLGRHRILVVFFDGDRGAGRSPVLRRLRRDFDRLQAADVKVLAVSTALPQENRKVAARTGEFPFPLLSDPGLRVHRAWGRLEDANRRPLTGVFLIDRAGRVAWAEGTPQPVPDPHETIDQLIRQR